jgi:hypothetical protein
MLLPPGAAVFAGLADFGENTANAPVPAKRRSMPARSKSRRWVESRTASACLRARHAVRVHGQTNGVGEEIRRHRRHQIAKRAVVERAHRALQRRRLRQQDHREILHALLAT